MNNSFSPIKKIRKSFHSYCFFVTDDHPSKKERRCIKPKKTHWTHTLKLLNSAASPLPPTQHTYCISWSLLGKRKVRVMGKQHNASPRVTLTIILLHRLQQWQLVTQILLYTCLWTLTSTWNCYYVNSLKNKKRT